VGELLTAMRPGELDLDGVDVGEISTVDCICAESRPVEPKNSDNPLSEGMYFY
jgi:hypothetical protein